MNDRVRLRISGGAMLALVALATVAHAQVCIIGPNPDLPPQCFGGNGYVSPNDVHMIIDGLPPGTTIRLDASHREFFNVTHGMGGSLGGEFEQFTSFVQLHMTGTGDLTGFNRLITIPNVQVETHIGPRNPGDPVQSFDTTMFALQGQITGDPDFDLLRITAGDSFGLPSPGHTTLTQLPGGNWNVDSFFDITYRIDFVGAPGSVLGGMSGSTTGTIRMQAGIPEPATLALTSLGLLGFVGLARRRFRG